MLLEDLIFELGNFLNHFIPFILVKVFNFNSVFFQKKMITLLIKSFKRNELSVILNKFNDRLIQTDFIDDVFFHFLYQLEQKFRRKLGPDGKGFRNSNVLNFKNNNDFYFSFLVGPKVHEGELWWSHHLFFISWTSIVINWYFFKPKFIHLSKINHALSNQFKKTNQ